MRRILLPASLALAALVASPTASAQTVDVCAADNITQHLLTAGKLDANSEKFGEKVNLIRCGDVTADGIDDAVFTVSSGGTAGDTHFGVLRGDDLVLYRNAYKVGIARRNRRSFETLQPHYRAHDPNCCPSSFRKRRFTWTGSRFKAGKAKKLNRSPARFYRP